MDYYVQGILQLCHVADPLVHRLYFTQNSRV